MRRLKIAVDIDVVIADFVSTFRELVRERLKFELRYEDIYVHDLNLVLGLDLQSELMPLVHETIRRDPTPVLGARESLGRLAASHDIILVTARPSDLDEVTRAWLTTHEIPHHSLHHMPEAEKNSTNIELDVVIDDHLKELLGFINKVPELVIFDRPWNQTFNVKQHVTRVRTWPEVETLVDRIASRLHDPSTEGG